MSVFILRQCCFSYLFRKMKSCRVLFVTCGFMRMRWWINSFQNERRATGANRKKSGRKEIRTGVCSAVTPVPLQHVTCSETMHSEWQLICSERLKSTESKQKTLTISRNTNNSLFIEIHKIKSDSSFLHLCGDVIKHF